MRRHPRAISIRIILTTALVILLGGSLIWASIQLYPYASTLINNKHLILANIWFSDTNSTPHEELPLTVPPGFNITVFADGIEGARGLYYTPFGLVVSSPKLGEVYLLKDLNGDGIADHTRVLLKDLNRPSGITANQQWLFIAETDAIVQIDIALLAGETEPSWHRIASIPGGGDHWRRTIGIGPDQQLYVSVGSTCNVCIEANPQRATILRFSPDGGDAEIIATGIRNSAGFDWDPMDQQLYATENGRDWLGDDLPQDELLRIQQGGFYGWPFTHGGRPTQSDAQDSYDWQGLKDPSFGDHPNAHQQTSIPPVHSFRAHNAPLGIRFNRSTNLPEKYLHSAFVALHGSWNRDRPDGYKVVVLLWTEQGIVEENFVSGFLSPDGKIIGRPAELTQAPDGDLYISDDFRGRIYRTTYKDEHDRK